MSSKILIGMLSALATISQATAGTNAFDNSFGTDGKVLGTGFEVQSNHIGRTLLRQSDGKLLLAGVTSTVAGGRDFMLARLNADGSADSSFGIGGTAAFDFAGGIDGVSAAAIQADGKVILVGDCFTTKTTICAARINTDGSLDTSFANQGWFIHEFSDGDGTGRLFGVSVRSNGKIVMSGAREIGGATNNSWNGVVLQLTSTGALDQGFATAGIYQSVRANYDFFEGIAIDSENRVVVAHMNSEDLSAIRLLENGALDLAFNGSGMAGFVSAGFDVSYSVAVDENDRVLVGGRLQSCGWSGNSCAPDAHRFVAALTRFNENGQIDTDFGSNGITTVSVRDIDYMTQIVRDASGNLYTGIISYDRVGENVDYAVAVAKFNSSGQRLAFGDALGQVNGVPDTLHIAEPGDRELVFLRGMLLLPTGELYYSGTAGDEEEINQLVVGKLTAAGLPDTAFDTDGVKLLNQYADNASEWYQMLPSTAGNRLLLGVTGSKAGILAKIDEAGTFDQSFAGNGALSFMPNVYAKADGATVATDANGNIAVVFERVANTYGDIHLGIIKTDANGNRLVSFDGDGYATVTIPAGYTYGTTDGTQRLHAGFRSDGTLVIAVSIRKSDTHSVKLIDLDTTGAVVGNLVDSPMLGNAYITDMLVASNNQIYLAGRFGDSGGFATRLRADGDLDTAFGITPLDTADDELQPKQIKLFGNQLYVLADQIRGGQSRVALVKLLSTGPLDTSFGSNGRQLLGVGSAQAAGGGLLLRNDGKIFVTGTAFSSSLGDGQLFVARTLANGATDVMFGNSGSVLLGAATDHSQANDLLLGTDGRITVAGKCGNAACLARINSDRGVASIGVAALTFASQTLNTTSVGQTITLSNTGIAPLTINTIVVSGDFAQSNNCPVGDLEIGENCTITVSFTPRAEGTRTGGLVLDTDTDATAITLTGTGAAASGGGSGGGDNSGGGSGGGGGSFHWLLLTLLPLLRKRRAD